MVCYFLIMFLTICELSLASEALIQHNTVVSQKTVSEVSYLEALGRIIELAKHHDTPGIIVQFKLLNDAQRLKFANDACNELVNAELDFMGNPLYGDCYETIGKAMIATHKDIPSLYEFIKIAVGKNSCPSNSLLDIVLARFKNSLMWYDKQSNEIVLFEPEFQLFIQEVVGHCPLAYYFRRIINTARDQYCLKFNKQNLPTLYKKKYWEVCLSWFNNRRNKLSEEGVLSLYKILIEEKIIKKSKLNSDTMYNDFKTFYKYVTGKRKLENDYNSSIYFQLDSFFLGLSKKPVINNVCKESSL